MKKSLSEKTISDIDYNYNFYMDSIIRPTTL